MHLPTLFTQITIVPIIVWRCLHNTVSSMFKHTTSTIITLRSRMTRLWQSLRMDLRGYKSSVQTEQSDHRYDTDSFLIGIDNHASASMTNTSQDFVGTTKTVHAKIKGIKGYLNTTKVGTVRWTIQDDQGRNHRFDIPGTYLVPDLPI